MGYYTDKAKEVKAKQDAELEQLKAALQTLGVETEEKENTANAERHFRAGADHPGKH